MAKMTIRECMDAAFQLLNQYTITGSYVPLSYNDQADAENRMLNLINDAQMTIATVAKGIPAYVEEEIPEPDPNSPIGEIEITMPEDFDTFIGITFVPAGGRVRRYIDATYYRWLGNDNLLLPDRPAGTYRIEYNRYPERYTADTPLTTELDNTPDTHEIIPYFVAAMIATDENPKTYYALYNVWETRLSRLGYKPAHAVPTQVFDVYGFDHFGGVC